MYDSSYYLLNTKKLPNLVNYPEEEIVKLLALEPEIQQDYAEVRFVCESDEYTFVPASFFQEREMDAYLNFQFEQKKEQSKHYNLIDEWDVCNVFLFNRNYKNAIAYFYADVNAEHHLSYFLTDKIDLKQCDGIHTWKRDNYIDIIASQNNSLLLVNSFETQTDEDCVYHILNVYGQLSLNTETDYLYLHNVDKTAVLPALVRNFVKHTKVIY